MRRHKRKQDIEGHAVTSAGNVTVQRKLAVGAVNDPLEQEADDMAGKVMRMPQSPFARHKSPSCSCDGYDDEHVQLKSSDNQAAPFIQEKSDGAGTASNSVSGQIKSTMGGGYGMDGSTRSFMESRFDTDFGGVKIHTGEESADLNRSLNARAFTINNNIYFNSGQYEPETSVGKYLLAHELTHVLQQDSAIRRKMPGDSSGRPLGFVPTPEQEQYDKDTFEIEEWKKVLERLNKGELNDNDLTNWRLRNRLTGLTTAEVNALINKIKAFKVASPNVNTDKIVEWLEVRKVISTPMPDGATVNKDPITQAITSYTVTINNIRITVNEDRFGNAQNDTGPVTSFGRSFNWHATHNVVDRLTTNDSGSNVAINPTSLEVTIQTSYHDSPDGTSGYGKGTEAYDKEEKTTTLRVHEGKHGSDYLGYFRKNPFPVDISRGVVGVLTVAQMTAITNYINGITRETCEATDQVGFTQDEFLKTAEGRVSGITSCRRH